MHDDASNGSRASGLPSWEVSAHALLLLGIKRRWLFSVEDCGTAMIWFFVVVKGDFRITIEAEEEVVADVVWGEFSKPFLGENGTKRMVKFI